MIMMSVVVKIKSGKQEEFLQTIRSLNGNQKKHEGLKKFTLCQEIEDKTGFSLIYEWESQEDLDWYLGGEKFKVLLGALKVLCEKSEIKYSHFSEKLPDVARNTYESWSELETG